ncbi:MAG: hypothetical protein JWQ09_398 [Segetibacter sp.]|nr:hypothetical protein [Segetibacter sp.]
MKRNFTLVLLLVAIMLVASSAKAQNKIGKVTGSAKSADEKAIEGATVSLLKAKDSSLAKVALSDKSGNFEMEKINEGKYVVKITAVGYAASFSKTFEITEGNSTIALNTISLLILNKQLGNVQVTTTRPLIENKIDKTVVNVEASVTSVGSTAMDVLEKSPGVSIDKDGNISLKGKQGVIILMDGKPTYLSGQDLANLLKNTSAGQLDQIEIMSQPSAKYDASGNSGVINIKTKRSKQNGFNGSITLGYTQGVYPKSSNSFNINSRKGKVNLFANYSYFYWKGFSELTLNRKFRDRNTKLLTGEISQVSDQHFVGQPHNLKVGMDFFATKKTTYGIVLNGFYNLRNGAGSSLAELTDGTGAITSYNNATSSNRDPWINYSVNFNYRHVFDTTGKELTADVDFIGYNTKSNQNSYNDSLNASKVSSLDPYILHGNLPSDIKIYTAKADFSQPLKGGARFEAGIKTSFVKTDNDAQYTIFKKASNNWENDTTRSNHFLYDEMINAAYVNYNKQIKKWGFQFGLRFENTYSKGNQIKYNQIVTRNYRQLFPTSYISYSVNKNNNLGLSYGRRIERPNYQDLNPFIYFLDKYTYREGNSYLTPQFSHNIELSHNYKGQLNTSVNFTRTTDIINDILQQNDTTKVTFQTKRNIAIRRNIGISISYNKPLTKYWTISAFVNGFNNFFEGYINNAYLSTSYTSFMANVSNQFRFSKGWSAEISGFYRAKTLETGLIVSNPMGMFSFGAGKQVLKNKGTIRLNVRDPFWLMKFSGYTQFDNIDVHIKSKWDNRQVSVNFTYRFGKNNNNLPQRKRTNASQDEQSRVGTNSQ